MSGIIKRLFSGALNKYNTWHNATLAKKLTVYGLRNDDLYDPLRDEDVAEALRRVPMDVIVERNCRLKRALILSLKKTELSEELQAKQTPFLQYLQPVVYEVQQERMERAQLGAKPPYTRIYY